jgi:hypothetical protein
MTLEALAMPLDIPWRRLAYSADMMDRDFAQLALPPRWRSSVAVFGHVVPVEETEDRYPDARIVYLRVTMSLTGWAPATALEHSVRLEIEGESWADWQYSTWEALLSSGWAARYWPCVGAMAQLGLHPHGIDAPTPDDLPYVVDFEPKKRELYETVTQTGEVLSGSADRLAVQKGQSSAESTEKSHTVGAQMSVSGGVPGIGVSATGSYEYGQRSSTSHETTEVRSTDTARERREAASHTTQLSQMYQLFTGYHLGTNRPLFLMFPRPHIAQSADQADINLINGERHLEGVQDLFVVVHLPLRASGLCLQLNLDTGHKLPFGPEPGTEHLPGSRRLVVTRRLIRACAEIGEDGRLHPVETPPHVGDDLIVGDLELDPDARLANRRTAHVAGIGRAERIGLADALNAAQATIRERMRSASARRYKPRRFVDTEGFAELAAATLQTVEIDLAALQKSGHLTEAEVTEIRALGVAGISELFDDGGLSRRKAADIDRIRSIRQRVLDGLLEVVRKD